MVYGNTTTYGQTIGILMLETNFPRIPGDIGNATTFPFPVVYRSVKGANPSTILKAPDPVLVQRFIDEGRMLVKEGARAIVTSCGFTAIFHKELAAKIDVPVFSSSLIQVKLVHSMLRPDQKVGIITASKPSLTDRHFVGAGIEGVPKVVIGMENSTFFKGMIEGSNPHEIDVQRTALDMQAAAKRLLAENPDVGAIVLECTNMPPFAKAVQEATGLPVFDIVTLTKYVYSAVMQQDYRGTM